MVAADAIAVEGDNAFQARDLPDNVRADFDKLRFDCNGPDDVLRLFPDAYCWVYRSDGDYGADYCHHVIIRLTHHLALSVSEKFDYDTRDKSCVVNVQWLDPLSFTYRNIAVWNNDPLFDDNGSHDDYEFNLGNFPAPMRIPHDWITNMGFWGHKWRLRTFGGIRLAHDSLLHDNAY